MSGSSYVLIDLSDENPTCGDCRSYGMLGKLFAEKTGRAWVQTANNEECHQIIKDNGLPDVVFTFKNRDIYKGLYKIHDENENLSYYAYRNAEEELVAHHLTPEILEQEKQIFAAKHGDIQKRLVAIMHITSNDDRQESVSKRLIGMIKASDDPRTTIYISAMARTGIEIQQDFIKKLKTEIIEQGLSQSIDIQTHDTKTNPDYNPYVGLIASADHFLVLGASMSIVSECLMSGKTVMLSSNNNHDNLIKRGICHRFENSEASEGFPTRSMEPVNITEAVVDGLIRHYRMHEAHQAAMLARAKLSPSP